MTVGERIYYCRTEKHMTQKELGEKTGIDAATIGKYERGILNPKVGTLRKIADALGCKLTDLDHTLLLHEFMNATANDVIPNLQQNAAEMMKALYGTADKTEARQVVFLRWYKRLDSVDQNSVFEVLKALQKLNSEGKQVAADRVDELTLIPKYQCTTTPAGNSTQSAGTGDENDPE